MITGVSYLFWQTLQPEMTQKLTKTKYRAGVSLGTTRVLLPDYLLPSSNVKAGLKALVLNVAASLLLKCPKYISKEVLELLRVELAGISSIYFVKTLPRDVEGGAVHVGGLGRGVGVALAEGADILLRPRDAGHDQSVEGHVVCLKSLDKAVTNLLQQASALRHQIGLRMGQFIYGDPPGIRHSDQIFSPAQLLSSSTGRDADGAGSLELDIIEVIEVPIEAADIAVWSPLGKGLQVVRGDYRLFLLHEPQTQSSNNQ